MNPALDAQTLLERHVLAGGVMMVFLVPLALLLVAFAVQGLVNLRRGRVCPRRFGADLAAALASAGGDRAGIDAFLSRHPSNIGRALHRVLRHLEMKRDADPAEVLRAEIEEECAALRQRNGQLAVVYNVAPLMGLLGTVFGLLRAFAEFARSANPDIAELSAGVNLALLTTAWGLSIAIPAYLVLYLFLRRIGAYERLVMPEVGMDALVAILRTGAIDHPSSQQVRREG